MPYRLEKKIDQLIHTLKGCLGQIGQTELVCYVIDIENRVKMGKIIALEELTDLRQKIRMIFKTTPLLNIILIFARAAK